MKDSDLLSYYGIIGIFMQYLENSEHINLIKRLSLAPSNDGTDLRLLTLPLLIMHVVLKCHSFALQFQMLQAIPTGYDLTRVVLGLRQRHIMKNKVSLKTSLISDDSSGMQWVG